MDTSEETSAQIYSQTVFHEIPSFPLGLPVDPCTKKLWRRNPLLFPLNAPEENKKYMNNMKFSILANTYKGMYRLTVAGSHLIGNLRLLCLLCLFCLLCCDCGIIVGGCHDVLLVSVAILLLCFFVVAVHVFFFPGNSFFLATFYVKKATFYYKKATYSVDINVAKMYIYVAKKDIYVAKLKQHYALKKQHNRIYSIAKLVQLDSTI